MKEVILYVHGKGGGVAESEHYKALFPECKIMGLDCSICKRALAESGSCAGCRGPNDNKPEFC